MKTEMILHRPLQQYDVLQRTSDSYFNASELVNAWSDNNGKKKVIVDFLRLASTKSFLKELEIQESHIGDSRNADFQAVKTVKGKMTKDGKTPDTVWMHPFLFIKLAMWINPTFEYHVIKFVYDQLIKFRHDAGDAYKDMCEALKLIGATKEDYASISRQLNVTCFDKHGKELRQFATEAQLKELALMESIIATNIRAGLLKSIAAVKVFITNYLIKKKTV
jgi:hypothetical protein